MLDCQLEAARRRVEDGDRDADAASPV